MNMIQGSKNIKTIKNVLKDEKLNELFNMVENFENTMVPLKYGEFMDGLSYLLDNDREFCITLNKNISEFIGNEEEVLLSLLESDAENKYEEGQSKIVIDKFTLTYLYYRFCHHYDKGSDMKHAALNEICSLFNISRGDKIDDLGIRICRKGVDGLERVLSIHFIDGKALISEADKIEHYLFAFRKKEDFTCFGFKEGVDISFTYKDLFEEDTLKEIKEIILTATDLGSKVNAKVTVSKFILDALYLVLYDYAKIKYDNQI